VTPPADRAAGLILASASARRRKILRDTGVPFRVEVTQAEEIVYERDPARTARENALRKAEWSRVRHPRRRIVAADTVIAFGGRTVGKPRTMREARDMLRRFSGRTHTVLTAVALVRPRAAAVVKLAASEVRFRRLTAGDIREYLQRTNPLDKAGAYDIDQHGDMLIASFRGSRTNIMGLPRELVARWLRRS
jgi:septum formation protein